MSRTARRGVCVCVSLQAADGDDLVPRPDSDGKGAGSPAQDSEGAVVGAVIGALEKGEDTASVQRLKLCLLERGKSGAFKVLKKILEMLSPEISSPCKNSFGKTIGVPKTASAGERPESSHGCAQSPRSILVNSLAQVVTAGRATCASLRRRWSLSTAPFASG